MDYLDAKIFSLDYAGDAISKHECCLVTTKSVSVIQAYDLRAEGDSQSFVAAVA